MSSNRFSLSRLRRASLFNGSKTEHESLNPLYRLRDQAVGGCIPEDETQVKDNSPNDATGSESIYSTSSRNTSCDIFKRNDTIRIGVPDTQFKYITLNNDSNIVENSDEESKEVTLTIDEHKEFKANTPIIQQKHLVCGDDPEFREASEYSKVLIGMARIYESFDCERAEKLYREALNVQQKAFGRFHIVYANTLHSLIWLLERQHKYDLLKPLLDIDMEIVSHTFIHSDTECSEYAKTLFAIAESVEAKGLFQEAESLYRKALFAQKHQSCRLDIGRNSTRFMAGGAQKYFNFDLAAQMYREQVMDSKRLHGPTNPKFTTLQNDYFQALSQQGRSPRWAPQQYKIRK